MTGRSLVVVSAGLGQPSATRLLADRLAAATSEGMASAGLETHVTTLELRGQARALADHLVTGFPSPDLRGAIDGVLAADGLIAVTPVFNASYSGLFKLFFDVLEPDALRGVPVLLGATGGTQRHSLVVDHALRPLFAYLGASIVPTGVFAATADWAGTPGADPALGERITRAGGELAAALRASPRAARADPFALAPGFDALLRGAASGPAPPDEPS